VELHFTPHHNTSPAAGREDERGGEALHGTAPPGGATGSKSTGAIGPGY